MPVPREGPGAGPRGCPSPTRPPARPAQRGPRGFPAALRSEGGGLSSKPSACAERGRGRAQPERGGSRAERIGAPARGGDADPARPRAAPAGQAWSRSAGCSPSRATSSAATWATERQRSRCRYAYVTQRCPRARPCGPAEGWPQPDCVTLARPPGRPRGPPRERGLAEAGAGGRRLAGAGWPLSPCGWMGWGRDGSTGLG